MRRLLMLGGTLMLALPRIAGAHAIHTTLTVVVPDVGERGMTINIRAFADDLSASVARFANRSAPGDSSIRADDATRYVRARVRVLDDTRREATLAPCGMRREREVYWLCFHVVLPAGLHGVRINNQMLAELHADQVNIVQLENGRTRKSYLFTAASQAAALGQ